MTTWDPAQYLKFDSPRLRPAIELLARIDHDAPAHVVDLGCGTGHITAMLAERWPRAAVTGVDNSAEMLDVARRDHPEPAWEEGDIAAWRPPGPVDVIYSNAALHWLDDHAALFPRLASHLAPGGVLAVQMPHNHGAPTHTLVRDAVTAGPWREVLAPLLRPFPVAEPAVYYDLLAPYVAHVDVWETEYLHVLTGDNPVAEWTKGSVLRPLLSALDVDQAAGFEAAYRERIAAAYPPRPDGTTLLPFRRLFVVATQSR